MKISELKVYLDEMPKKMLEKLVVELYQSKTFNQELIQNKIHPEDEETKLEKYKKIIKDEFFPERGFGKLRYGVMRKALSNFKKISKNPKNIGWGFSDYMDQVYWAYYDYQDE